MIARRPHDGARLCAPDKLLPASRGVQCAPHCTIARRRRKWCDAVWHCVGVDGPRGIECHGSLSKLNLGAVHDRDYANCD